MNKIINSLIISWMLLGWVQQWISAQTQKPTKAPQSKNIQYKQATQKKVAEVLVMDHDTLIKQSFSSILEKYWMEAGTDTIKQHILIELNNERAKVGAAPLRLDSSLQIIAKNHAEFLFDHRDDYISDKQEILQEPHFQWFPDGTYNCVRERLINVGYRGMKGTENIFFGMKPVGKSQEERRRGKKTINHVVKNWWKDSPSHKKSMLDPEYEDVWIYVVGDIVVAVFGKKDGKKRNRTITKS